MAGGAPTLKLNDGGVATYASGSGSNALTFNYTVAAGQNTASLAATAVNLPTGVTIADGAGNAANLSLTGLTQTGPQIDTATPTVTKIIDSPATGDLAAGKTVALTLDFSSAVTVAGGAPTLKLNDGGVATYASGSGSNALTFNYTVAAGQNTASLAATAVNLPTGVTIADGAGNAANLSLTGLTQTGPQIDTATPTVTKIIDLPATGDLAAGKTVALTLDFSSAVTVAGGAPTLKLNDGGVATYASGSGSNALTFNYTVAAGQNTASLAATAVNLPTGVTIADGAGNAANLSLTGLTQTGPQIDTATPTVTKIIDLPATGDLAAGKTVALTLDFSSSGDGGRRRADAEAQRRRGRDLRQRSGTNALTFNYTVAAGQNTASLAATAVNLPTGVTIADGAGNAANLSLTGLTQTGPQIDTTTPTVTKIIDSPATGDLAAGKTVALTLDFSSAVTVAGGAPTLKLNDGGVATYASGSGSNALTFNYTVAAGQNTASLAATAVNLPTGVTIADGAGNAANLSLTGLTQTGPQIDTATPTVTKIIDSPATGDLAAGKTVALTLDFSSAVTVAGGAPTLKLNDGGVATYASGSGSNALTFNYTVAAGQNTASLAATAVNLPTGVTIADGAGNAANLSLTGLTQTGPQIDTATPTVTKIIDSPATGDLAAGKTVALTLDFSSAVTVAGGAPTLKLNDGGVATYASGSGSNALTFNYTVAAGQNTASLAATAVNLPTGVTIADGAGNAANLSLTGLTQTGPQIDTTAPIAPVISSDTVSGSTVTLGGTAEAGSTITVFDGATKLGAIAANSSGGWTYPTGALSSGTQTMTATATDAAGNVSAASSPVYPVIGTTALSETVSVSGTPMEGQKLTANVTVNDSKAAISYQWQYRSGWTWKNIAGATASTLTLGVAQEGESLRVVATAVDGASKLTKASWATTAVKAAPPVLTIADTSLSVTAGGQVAMGVHVTVPEAGDTVNVKINGLPSYETITDAYDGKTFKGSSITLSAAQVDSGLTLKSNYTGPGLPVATLTLTATNGASSAALTTTASQTLTVTDPPGQIGSSSLNLAKFGFDNNTTLGYLERSASAGLSYLESRAGAGLTVANGANAANLGLLLQYAAAGFQFSNHAAGGAIFNHTEPMSSWTNHLSLTKPAA